MGKIARTLGLGVIVAFLATPALAQDADWSKVEAAAQKEGVVSFYTSFLGNPRMLALVDRFQAETRIKVQLLHVVLREQPVRRQGPQGRSRRAAQQRGAHRNPDSSPHALAWLLHGRSGEGKERSEDDMRGPEKPKKPGLTTIRAVI